MQRRPSSASRWLLVVCVVLVPAWSLVRAADTETRDFNVNVDGKRAGAAHMKFEGADDGTITMSSDTDVTVPILVVNTFKYRYRGTEVLKDGRLLKFESTCNDDGKRYVVTAAAEDKGVRVKANKQERIVSKDVWLTSYWHRPDNNVVNQTVPLVDADTGRDLEAKVSYVGQEEVAINGQTQKVLHFRLTGKVEVDLWYDSADRIVRQEWMEDGHKMLVELAKIRK